MAFLPVSQKSHLCKNESYVPESHIFMGQTFKKCNTLCFFFSKGDSFLFLRFRMAVLTFLAAVLLVTVHAQEVEEIVTFTVRFNLRE